MIRLVNEHGYQALCQLAADQPQLFLDASPERLRDAMITAADRRPVWGARMDLRTEFLGEINVINRPGPERDATDARRLERALPLAFTPASAANRRLWSTLNCFHLADYVPIRWGKGRATHQRVERFVADHWLKWDWRANAAQRLWGLRLLSRRISQHCEYSQDALMETMAGNVGLYHQILSRPVLAANARVLGAIYQVVLNGNDHLFSTKGANEFLKTIMQRAAALTLDVMPDETLLKTVSAAVPAKKKG